MVIEMILAAFLGCYVVSSLILFKFPMLLHKKKDVKFVCRHISHRGGKDGGFFRYFLASAMRYFDIFMIFSLASVHIISHAYVGAYFSSFENWGEGGKQNVFNGFIMPHDRSCSCIIYLDYRIDVIYRNYYVFICGKDGLRVSG